MPDLDWLLHSHRGIAALGAGIPSWAAGASQAWDFTAGRYYNSAAVPTDTHGQTINADDAAGAWAAFAPNALVRTSRGLQTSPTRAQGLTNPIALAGLGWNASPNTAVTDNQPGAPDGTSTVSRLQHLASSSTSLVQTITGTAATYTASIFYRRRAGSAANTFRLGLQTAGPVGSDNTNSVLLTATDEWQRGSYSATLVAGNCYFVLDNADNSTATDVEVWCAQVEPGAFAGPPILSKTTVAGNLQVISGLGTQLAGGVYGFVQVDIREPGSNFVRLLEFNNGAPTDRMSLVYISGGISWVVRTGDVEQTTIAAKAWASGMHTLAFAAGTNFAQVQSVGSAQPTPDTGVAYPPVDRVAVGGLGFSNLQNTFQNTRLLALWYGQPDATKFGAVYAKAVQAHALAA